MKITRRNLIRRTPLVVAGAGALPLIASTYASSAKEAEFRVLSNDEHIDIHQHLLVQVRDMFGDEYDNV